MRLNEPSLLDQIVLAVIAEEPRHGFAVAEIVATDEALSSAVSVRRSLVYRSIDDLLAAGLIAVARREAGARGRPRVVYRASRAGRAASTKWLDAVVPHPRDARLELLAKFALRERRGMPSHEFAERQRLVFEPIATALRRGPVGESTAADLVRRWRHEAVVAMIGLLRDLESPAPGSSAHRARASRGAATG